MSIGKLVTLGDVTEIVMGQAPRGAECNKDGRGQVFVKAGEFGDRRPLVREWTTNPLKIAQLGDVLVCVVGATAGKINGSIDCAIGRSVAAVRPNAAKLVSTYLYHFLATQVMRLRAKSQGLAQSVITREMLREIAIPLPPLPEQRRIADVLDRAEALRAERRAALAHLDILTQSIFIEMFGDPVKNPRGFPVRSMIELIDQQRPISYGILMPGPDQVEGVKYVRVVDMKNGGIELSGIRKTTEAMSNSFRRSLLKPGDLLMSIRGHVGRLAVVPPQLNGANITQDTARLAIVGASSVFVRECLRTEGFQRWMAKHTKGVAVRGINLGDVKLMPIILPPQPAQDKFARQANAVEKLNTSHRASLTELDALFATLQHRAFRGEL